MILAMFEGHGWVVVGCGDAQWQNTKGLEKEFV